VGEKHAQEWGTASTGVTLAVGKIGGGRPREPSGCAAGGKEEVYRAQGRGVKGLGEHAACARSLATGFFLAKMGGGVPG